MANNFTSLHYHLVFSTKHREPWITSDIEERVWSFMGGIARENGFKALQIGGRPEHVHLLLAIPPTSTVSQCVQALKGGSSRWVKTLRPGLGEFAWQDGYGAFTVSASGIDATIKYITSQAEHHRVKTFQEEFMAFIAKHQIPYDPKYLWG